MNILLTGATGFIGKAIAQRLQNDDRTSLTCSVRQASDLALDRQVIIADLTAETDWSDAFDFGQQVVIHAAARAHVMNEGMKDLLSEYRKINVEGTLNLARQSARAGVKRFIYLSSIKVNGEQTPRGEPFNTDSFPAPEDPYGLSKWEAEQGLKAIASETGMELVIIRPPLVYGPGVKGNFETMVNIVRRGWPLPLGSVKNERTLVGLDNLVDLIVTSIDHPAAANRVFLAGDGQDVSTTELLRAIGRSVGKPARLIPVPSACLMIMARLLGKGALAQRLLGSLQVDISETRNVLGWEPPFSLNEGLSRYFSGGNF